MKQTERKIGFPGKPVRNVLRRFVITMLLVMTLAFQPMTGSVIGSNGYAASETVQVERVVLDSLIIETDRLMLQNRILEIDCWEIKKRARVDSVMYEERLKLLREERGSWLERVMKHPVMDAAYFVLGVYVGAYAVQSVR